MYEDRIGSELVPCFLSGLNDIVIGLEDAIGQPVLTQELPNVLDGIEFRCSGWKPDQCDIARNVELSGRVPGSPVHDHGSMSLRRDHGADFIEVVLHGACVGIGHDQTCPHAA